jgi:hypothetical protein
MVDDAANGIVSSYGPKNMSFIDLLSGWKESPSNYFVHLVCWLVNSLHFKAGLSFIYLTKM